MTPKPSSYSYHDPSGFIYYKQQQVFRQINQSYKDDYNYLIKSGLYQILVEHNLLIPHEEEKPIWSVKKTGVFKIIKPEKITMISYPYEWCFSQLRDAALLTLNIMKIALGKGMIIKDASPYNIQFRRSKPVLIDSLSFQTYVTGKPWVAYRQFCELFLAPLTLMAYQDVRLNKLLLSNSAGLPLDLTVKLLPAWTRLNYRLFMHLFLHSFSQKKFSEQSVVQPKKLVKFPLSSLLGLIESLGAAVLSLKLKSRLSKWSTYFNDNSYSQVASSDKVQNIDQILAKIKPRSVWDFGANTGKFARLAENGNRQVVAFESDHNCVEMMYAGSPNYLPLWFDFLNPSPALGWQNNERTTLVQRGSCDLLMCLALIHHLSLVNNIPFNLTADYFAQISNWLVIEFVPVDDREARKMIWGREEIFDWYTKDNFEESYAKYYKIISVRKIKDSKRIIYLFRKK